MWEKEEAQKRPLTLEIIGAAGSGKSTLARLLSQEKGRFAAGPLLLTSRPQQMPATVRHLAAVLPTILQRPLPPLTWTEIKLMIYLSGWHQRLSTPQTQDKIIYLDQGPIYSLARLDVLDRPLIRSAPYLRWRERMLEQWSRALDLVIWLDAPDEVLWQRIQTREQAHEVKHEARDTAFTYLQSYRQAFDKIVNQLKRQFSVQLINFDTSHSTPDQLLEVVRSVVEAARPSATRVATR